MLNHKKGKPLKLGSATQASGAGALLKPAGASLPARAFGGGGQTKGLSRGSLKPSAVEEDDGFDADDWFKDYEIDPEDVDDGSVRSQSTAENQNNYEDEVIDIISKAAPQAVEKQPPSPPPQRAAVPEKSAAPALNQQTLVEAQNSPPSSAEKQLENSEKENTEDNALNEMDCELPAEDNLEKEKEPTTTAAVAVEEATKASNSLGNDHVEEQAEKKNDLSSDDDLGGLLFGKDDDEEDEVMIDAPLEKAAPSPAVPASSPIKATESSASPASTPASAHGLRTFHLPVGPSRSQLPTNSNKTRVPSRLGPGRTTPPLPTAAAPEKPPETITEKITSSFSPLFPSSKSPGAGIAPLLHAQNKAKQQQLIAVAGTPTPITPAGEIQNRGGALITPGTTTPLISSVSPATAPAAKSKPAAEKTAAAQIVTPTTASPSAPPAPSPTVLDIDDALLKIDFSARADAFLSTLEDEDAATKEALATPTAKKVFSLSTSVAAAGVETESLTKRLEEVDVNLSMLRLRYAVDAVEAAVMGNALLGGAPEKTKTGVSDGAAAGAALGGETEAMDVDIMS